MLLRPLRQGLFAGIVIIILFITSVGVSYSSNDSINYGYDDLNRLIRIENLTDGKVVEFQYDEVGNRTQKGVYNSLTITATAGSNGSISPAGAVAVLYNTNKTFTITANSGYQIQDVLVDSSSKGLLSTYTFNSVTSNHTIAASFTIYTAPVKIGSTSYNTLQAAYNAAANGAVIKVKAINLTENLNVNRNISVNLEGGYNVDFTSIIGITTLKGMIQTFSGGGTLTIKNFNLTQ